MASRNRAVAENVPGNFYVDNTCIDCGTCQHVAPETFDDAGDYSFVFSQPENGEGKNKALYALLACPVGSIGTDAKEDLVTIRKDFPLLIAGNIFYCGFTSPKSYGASSYFIEHPEGNWLVDSPKFLPQLVSHFEAKGGLRYIFLSHSDDVADADLYAKHFKAERIFHEKEIWSQPDTERVITGENPIAITPDFLVIPTPGHTKGHCVLLYQNRFLFTGDHMWWEIKEKRLGAPENFVWNRKALNTSLEKLLTYPFEWVLPGHGAPMRLSSDEMTLALKALVSRISMRS